MGFKLKKGVFRAVCTHPGCTFNVDMTVTQNIMGMTEADVESEAIKLVKDMANIKHDALHGRNHELTKPTIKKVSGIFEPIGATKSSLVNQNEAVKYVEYKKGDIVIKKGDIASTICEVVKGSVYVDINKNHIYNVGDSFGAAALLSNQSRTADVIANEDGTRIAFYNLKELNKKDPKKAKELYNEAMEDIFKIVSDLETLVSELEEKYEKEKMISENRKERIKEIENQLIDANRRITELS